MVLYSNYGKDLIAEFPVEDCYITHLCVADGWLFAATSKSMVRVYRWPILEEECCLEITNLAKGTVKYKLPPHAEYSFWTDGEPITRMHKLAFTSKIMVVRGGGAMSLLAYDRVPSERGDESGDRKKMMNIMNEAFYITKNDSEKRNRMIEKTEGDIVKVENEIAKEKSVMERKYREECQQIESTFQSKCELQQQEKNEYLSKLQAEMKDLRQEIDARKKDYQLKRADKVELYAGKTNYESAQNRAVEEDTEQLVASHKQRVQTMMEEHKENIRRVKNGYREKIIEMRQEFEAMVNSDFPQLLTRKTITPQNTHKRLKSQDRCSIQLRVSHKPSPSSTDDINLTPDELM